MLYRLSLSVTRTDPATMKYGLKRIQKVLISGLSCRYVSSSAPSTALIDKIPKQSLPRLPVPSLQQTLDKYLLTVKPLVTSEEFETTEKVVKDFKNGVGVKLQELLEERARNHENWLSNWWLHHAYLGSRMPLPIHSSPAMVCSKRQFKGKDNQIYFAAKLIRTVLEYKSLLESNKVPVEVQGGKPLDMSQYYKIFSTCRIPGRSSDSLVYHGWEENPPIHICVMHNNHFFKLEAYGNDGQPLNVDQLVDQLQQIVTMSTFIKKDPIGVLTTEDRKTWAEAYIRLSKVKKNKESLKIIETSMFLVCLDKKIKEKPKYINEQTEAAVKVIHGVGAENHNSGNRWYDKTMQFVVGVDGEFGIAYEHSPAEGPPVAKIMDNILQYYVEKKTYTSNMPSADINPPMRLRFELSEESEKDIQIASRDLDSMIADVEFSCFLFDDYGKDFIKSKNLSPDSYIQMAMQLAFYKIHNCLGATYETAATRQFLHGRTDVIRSASMEVLSFCRTMTGKSISNDEKVASLRNAVEGHKKYSVEAVSGYGIDRHLLGLKLIAIENGYNVPDLYLDDGYITSSHFKISSSQVSSNLYNFMVYGPLVPDGYGCCYNPLNSEIYFGLSACNSSPETFSGRFMESLEESLTEMRDIFQQMPKSKL